MSIIPRDFRFPTFSHTGIVLAYWPSSSPGFNVEIQRTNGSSTGTFVKLAIVDPAHNPSMQYFDHLPVDNVTRYYRARHVREGYNDGPYTRVVSGKPGLLPIGDMPQMPLTGAGVSPDIWLTSTSSIKVGSAGSSSFVTKKLRFPATQYIPINQGSFHSYGLGTLIPNTTTGSQTYRAPYIMPKGVTVTTFRACLQRKSTAASAVCKLYRVSTAGTATLVTTLTASAGASPAVVESSALSETISTANYFIGDLAMNATTATNAAALLWTEFDYRMSNYQFSI